MKKRILTNSKVIEAWQHGQRAAHHRGTLQCYSDGTLYSYGLTSVSAHRQECALWAITRLLAGGSSQ